MPLTLLSPKQALNKAYLKEKVSRSSIELFKKNLKAFLDGIDEKESEEYVKNNVTKFLYDTYYNGKNQINTKGRIDLAIYEDKKPVVIIEAKRPSSPDMVSVKDINSKATHELILYYLQERVDHGNIDIKYLIITNMYEWFIFDASVFDRLFYKDSLFMKDFIDWKNGRKARPDRDLFYNDIAKSFFKSLKDEIAFTWFDFREVENIVRNNDPKNDSKLIHLYKLLSPAHLLKQPFANDSNTLDTRFYSELLHLIGLEEVKDGGKKIIQRKGKRDPGSLLENTINLLVAEDRLRRLPNLSAYGDTTDDQLFNIALELGITWINRILFLKLLEGQLRNYHGGDKQFRFLDFKTIPNYDELNKLFFQVLARKVSERSEEIKNKFAHVPYLNSSLFDISALEAETIHINSLDEGQMLKLAPNTVLKTESGKKREGEMPTLQYLFEFLDAYDFNSEGTEEIQEENKALINASVLGLIFEKINGYKDGSFFTPGFITMYMCRETIRKAVVQKFNEAKGWKNEDFDQLYNQIKDVKEANQIINSLKICDPAVGSGHFLVSALNEIITIKSELGILADHKGNILRDYAVEVVNDELIVSINHHELFEYKPGNKESQRIQEALFHEKEGIIENCLFGVDINQNSVKICRLRLWIEMLKSAYYTDESKYSELETLPNIDINIKQGNSLISRFPLDADLSKALKSIKYNIDDYRAFVNSYKNATDKEEKRGFEALINQIKSDFRSEISKSDPKILRKNKLAGELYNLLNQAQVFEPSEKEKKERERKKEKLQAEINRLVAEIEEIKESAIYKDAFEWRFEFPEVLDTQGKFKGFDTILGNPPYGILPLKAEKELIFVKYPVVRKFPDSYCSFVALTKILLKNDGNVSLIIPNTFCDLESCDEYRRWFINEIDLRIIWQTGFAFDSAVVDTLVFFASNHKRTSKELLIQINESKFHRSFNSFLENDLSKIDYRNTEQRNKFLKAILNKSARFETLGSVRAGVKLYELGKGIPPQTKALIKAKPFTQVEVCPAGWRRLIRGSDINRYILLDSNEYVNYGPWLAAPRDAATFEGDRIIMRRTDDKLFSTFISDDSVCVNSCHIIKLFANGLVSYRFILALLNSRLMQFLFETQNPQMVGKTFAEIKVIYISLLPIVLPPKSIQNKVENIADRILAMDQKDFESNASALEQDIDKLIYQLYGLKNDEIEIVEGK